MQSSDVKLEKIDPSNSVLLLGAGFSLESKNVDNLPPPNGTALRHHFIRKLHLPPETDYDIKVLADEFAQDDAQALYEEIYKIFRVSEIGVNQSAILDEKWMRLYSTNYDDVVEKYRIEKKLSVDSFDCSEEIPKKLPTGAIVHLHGSIRVVMPENIRSSLVLGEKSYVTQYIERSPWYSQFQTDIKFCANLFVIGYSMSDYHISALLMENPDIAKKTIFIQGPKVDDVFVRRTKEYGNSFFIGLSGFVDLLRRLPRPGPMPDIRRLKAFRWLDPMRDKKTAAPPTANEVFDLLSFGAFNYLRVASFYGGNSYVISRSKEIEQAASDLLSHRCIVLDGRFGNGKTIFEYLLALELSARGFTCFFFKGNFESIEGEIKAIAITKSPIIFFDNYVAGQDALPRLAESLPNAKFVVEIRSSIFEVRYHEVEQKIPRPFSRVSVNMLSREDVSSFLDLVRNAGLGASIEVDPARPIEMRELLLLFFESKSIQERISEILSPLVGNANRKKILLISTLLSMYQIPCDSSFIKRVVGVDPYQEFRPIQDIASEVFAMGLDEFTVRSSSFSEFVVRRLMSNGDMSDCIIEATRVSAGLKSERRYRVLMSNLMQFSNLQKIFAGQGDVVEKAVGIYESLRYDERINNEPLFWLQYAIAMTEDGKFQPAHEFIKTAYARAALLSRFQTYQIDTQAFRILLLLEINSPAGKSVSRFSEILEKLAVVNSLLREESHRDFAIKVLENIGPFVNKRGADLGREEALALSTWLQTLSATLEKLPMEYRARSGSDNIRGTLEAVENLLQGTLLRKQMG